MFVLKEIYRTMNIKSRVTTGNKSDRINPLDKLTAVSHIKVGFWTVPPISSSNKERGGGTVKKSLGIRNGRSACADQIILTNT